MFYDYRKYEIFEKINICFIHINISDIGNSSSGIGNDACENSVARIRLKRGTVAARCNEPTPIFRRDHGSGSLPFTPSCIYIYIYVRDRI